MKSLPKLLLFLCAVALLLGLVLYATGMKHTTNRTEITFMVKADSTGMVTPETRAMADSIVGVLTKDEQLLADKYQYVIDQQAKTQDFFCYRWNFTWNYSINSRILWVRQNASDRR